MFDTSSKIQLAWHLLKPNSIGIFFQPLGLRNSFSIFKIDKYFFDLLGQWPLFPTFAVVESFFRPFGLMTFISNPRGCWILFQPSWLMNHFEIYVIDEPFPNLYSWWPFPFFQTSVFDSSCWTDYSFFWNPLIARVFSELMSSD